MKFELWAMREAELIDYFNARQNIQVEKIDKDIQARFDDERNSATDMPRIMSVSGDTATVTIEGILKQNGPDLIDLILMRKVTSYKDIIAAANLIKSDDQIKNLSLNFDTPGGQLLGSDKVWQTLFSLRENADITAVNRGLMASAGYYLASASHEILSDSETNLSGSIGVMAAGFDRSELRKKYGVKEIILVSKNAPDKAEGFETKKGRELIQNMLDQAEQFFINRISQGRELDEKHITKNFGRGDVLFSKTLDDKEPDALSVGMIDAIIPVDGKGDDRKKRRRGQRASLDSQIKQETVSPVLLKNKQEEKMPKLDELLKDNLDAKAEFDRRMESQLQTGINQGRQEAKDTADKVFALVKHDSPYMAVPQIKQTMSDVLKGEQPFASLQNIVAVYDMTSEQGKSKNGKETTDETPETPPASPEGKKTDDGMVTDKDSAEAAIKKIERFI